MTHPLQHATLICGLSLSLFVVSCQSPSADVNAVFDTNAVTIAEIFADFSAEDDNMYRHYDENAIWRGTGIASPDTITLAQAKAYYSDLWSKYDFELVSEANFLPGVDAETKKTDGSVRGYFTWAISKPATDSTERKTVEVKLYESFDFTIDGKIAFAQVYGNLESAYASLED